MLDKAYSHPSVEGKWVAAWKEAALFRSTRSQDGRKAYTIVIPPPNVTGALHIGHALNNTLQDILVRYHRMHGREACWVFGTDHGGIATQNVMEKQLKAEGTSRQALGREAFLERMHGWVRDTKQTITGQLQRLGCSLDFSREAFTMDEARAKAVMHTFRHFYDQGLIRRGERMVNWCVRCGTALSDIEVEYEERKGKLWHLRYPFEHDPGSFLVVATTRPETMLGDTAVAVHPHDQRYKHLVGKRLRLPLVGRSIPVVADPVVDPSFGTGAVKVTPFHDPNDFEIWQRHKAEMPEPPQVIGLDGRMTPQAGAKYAGLSREKARDQVVADLSEEKGADGKPLLLKTEEYRHSVGGCYRCNQPVEPLVSEQWFMKMGPLAEPAIEALDKGDFRIVPETWAKPYRDWLYNIKDWCLSRQIWWGHRIPVWYCGRCLADKLLVTLPDAQGGARTARLDELLKEGVSLDTVKERASYRLHTGGAELDHGVAVQAAPPGPCPRCRQEDWLQDQDVLDTWFSSALWPLSVFGWPEETEDLKFYYPTSVLVTGYEIIYLWVARMQMMGLHFRKQVPFHDCFINGIVRDKSGKKMSKSLGNVVDPLVMMDKYGTDAFRFALAAQAYTGRDIPFAEDSVVGPRNFANKIWNSTRFVLMNLPEPGRPLAPLDALDRSRLDLSDRWLLSEYQSMLARVRSEMEAYNVASAADAVYGFLWDKFCAWYVELAKPRLSASLGTPPPEGGRSPSPEGAGPDAEVARSILVHVLSGTLKMLHPFMPFITEELHAALAPYTGETARFLLASGAPELKADFRDPDAVARMGFVMESVRSLRALREQLNVPPTLNLKVLYSGGNGDAEALLDHADYVRCLARVETLEKAAAARPAQSATAVAGKLTFYVPLAGIIDIDKERRRLAKEIERLAAELKRCDGQLSNPSFVERAPQDEVAKIRQRRQEFETKHASLAATLESLGAQGGAAPGGCGGSGRGGPGRPGGY